VLADLRWERSRAKDQRPPPLNERQGVDHRERFGLHHAGVAGEELAEVEQQVDLLRLLVEEPKELRNLAG
jgi:hypothetical protein